MPFFDNCSEAYQAGYANMRVGEPGYRPKLDRDHDGIACENPPPGFTPHTQTHTGGGTQAVVGGTLPKTGPGEVGAVGGGLLVLGVLAALVARRRRVRFTA